ncbi:hypothetical protein B296_00059005 [Ensete ventricosum]|uniref:Uncharacterized protein n=1 Tax=Ensete ventricosum TaxID=4639 RepID=A0A426X5Z5_ENSVE|nr:hypothetical protein B296_00059005 [Ensete ventricosum]
MLPLRFPNSDIRAKVARKRVADHGQGLLQRGYRLRPGQLARAAGHGQAVASLRQRLPARGNRLRLAYDRAYRRWVAAHGQAAEAAARRATLAGMVPVGRPLAGRSCRLQG